jgi:hypothetical protein
MKKTYLKIAVLTAILATGSQIQAMWQNMRRLATITAGLTASYYATDKAVFLAHDHANSINNQSKTTKNEDKINEDQMRTFLQHWPVCKENTKTEEFCNKTIAGLVGSPRYKHPMGQIVERLQVGSELAGKSAEDAQKATAHDLTTFLTVEYSVDPLKDFEEKKYPELAKFYKKYGLPHIESTWIADNVRKERVWILGNARHAFQDALQLPFGSIEGREKLFAKSNDIDRIINAERARNFIEQENLDTLDMAQKYLGYFDGNFKVIAETIEAHGKDRFTLKEVQQLTKFVEETGYRDWTGYNWTFDEQGKFVCFDTDDGGFAVGIVKGDDENGLPWNCKAIYAYNLYYTYANNMDEDAREWLKTRVEELLNSPEGKAKHTPISHNSRYDTPGMKFEQVKKEFRAWQEEKWKKAEKQA